MKTALYLHIYFMNLSTGNRLDLKTALSLPHLPQIPVNNRHISQGK